MTTARAARSAWTTEQVVTALRTRYAAPAFALLTEVPDGTGGQKVRTADALAMSLWPSRGLTLHGFEVKASRGDWLKELALPSKAERFWRYCDYWWLAVGDAGLVKEAELPPTWGLLAPRGDKLQVVREATVLTPEPIDRAFLAALFRKVGEAACSPEELQQKLIAAREEAITLHRSSIERDVKHLREDHAALLTKVRDFETASGITIAERWGTAAADVGRAVRLVLDGEAATKSARKNIEWMRNCMRQIDGELSKVLDGPREAQGCIQVETRAMNPEELKVAQEEAKRRAEAEWKLKNPELPFPEPTAAATTSTGGTLLAFPGGRAEGGEEEPSVVASDTASDEAPVEAGSEAQEESAAEPPLCTRCGSADHTASIHGPDAKAEASEVDVADAKEAPAAAKRTVQCPAVLTEGEQPALDVVCGHPGATRARGFCPEHKDSAHVPAWINRRDARRKADKGSGSMAVAESQPEASAEATLQ
jgi:hypothetical protein